ncbi:MAG TPA: ribosome silencing factor [Nevskiaceae bacterium]
MTKNPDIDPVEERARLARTALEELKAQDVREIDVRRLTPIADTMLICTGTSNRHVRALARAVIDKLRAHGVRPRGIEGLTEGEWVLVDLDSVIVHVMQAQTRAFYQLEKLWDLPAISDAAHAQ